MPTVVSGGISYSIAIFIIVTKLLSVSTTGNAYMYKYRIRY